MPKSFRNSMLLLIFGAFNLGFAPVFVKLIGLKGMGLTAIAFWRMLFAGVLFLIIMLWSGKKLTLDRRNILWAALAGLFFTLDLTVWHRSIMYAGAGISTILGNTQVFNTAILAYFLFREKPSLKFFIAAITAMIGVILLSGIGSDITFTYRYVLGIMFGLLTGILYAFYLVTLRKVNSSGSKPDAMAFIAWVCLFCVVFMGVASLFESESFMPVRSVDWLWLFLLALLVQVLGWWAIFVSLSNIEASKVGLVLLLQPTLATIWGYLIFRENLTSLQIIGGIITIASIYFGTVSRRKKED